MAVILEKGDGYMIASHGNGAAYSVTRESDNKSVFVQYGDAAATFRSNYDALDEIVVPRLRKSLLRIMCAELIGE